jgi:hypothetical protein
VDSQLAAIANGRKIPSNKLLRLTRIALSALGEQDLKLVCGAQPVVSAQGNIGSAIDFIATHPNSKELVLIELKTGYTGGRLDPAMRRGSPQFMQAPLTSAIDCLAHRHLAQLAATVAMFRADRSMASELVSTEIETISGLLLYVTDTDVEIIELSDWWQKRGNSILRSLR